MNYIFFYLFLLSLQFEDDRWYEQTFMVYFCKYNMVDGYQNVILVGYGYYVERVSKLQFDILRVTVGILVSVREFR